MKRILLTLSLLPLLLLACGKEGGGDVPDDGNGGEVVNPPVEKPDVPVFTGSFIQHWYVASWTQTQWDAEMKVLSEAGMEYLIFTPIKDGAAEPDYLSVEKCLKAAAAKGIKVFIGTNHDEGWWNSGISADWLNARMDEGLDIAREIYRRFHDSYGAALYGWYWDWEVDNGTWNNRKDLLATAWNRTLDGLTTLDPAMPLLFSPFMNPSMGTPAGYRDFWKALFPMLHLRAGDIFAPQDSVGAAGLTPTTAKSWFYQLAEAAKTVDGLRFWANIETFEQDNLSDGSHFATASFTRMVEQLKALDPFVERSICFAYSHYLSPVLVRQEYHDAWKAYLKDGSMPAPGKTGRVNSATKTTGTGVALSWSMATKTDVDGYILYRNGTRLVKLQVREGKYPDYYYDAEGKASDSYAITTYNINGDESPRVSF